MPNSPARAVIDVGSVIADTYTIEALLGRGGMGAVFLASHKRLAGKQVAIKILHTELADGEIVARFKREAEIAAKLNHPNIVGVIDYNVAPDGMPYLVLDYLEGETLAERIARGPLALDHVLSIVRQVGSALSAAHRAGIVHRDLKPQNIFLVPTEVDGRLVEIAKVLDFGISKIRGSQTVKTQDSTLLGTPQYMAPEQAIGQHTQVDERTDVFALGAIVYEMLTGEPAFAGPSIPAVVFRVVYEQPAPLAERAPSVSAGVVAAVAQAMAKPADERFQTVAAFVEALTGQPATITRGQAPAAGQASDAPSAARRVDSREAFDHLSAPLRVAARPGQAGAFDHLSAPLRVAARPGQAGAFDQTIGSGDHGASPVAPASIAAMSKATTLGMAPAAGTAAAPARHALTAHAPPQPMATPTATSPSARSTAGPSTASAPSAPAAPSATHAAPGPATLARRESETVPARPPAVASIEAEPAGSMPAAPPSRAKWAVAAVAAVVVVAASAAYLVLHNPTRAPDVASQPSPTASPELPAQPAPPVIASPTPSAIPAPTPVAPSAPVAVPPPGPARGATPTNKPAGIAGTGTIAKAPDKAPDKTVASVPPPKTPDHLHADASAAAALHDGPAADSAPADNSERPAATDNNDETARDKLEQASAALDHKSYEVAERLANAVINGPSGPKQRASAHVIHGIVQCALHNDQEAAQIDMRSLSGFPGMRARLVNVCRSHGIMVSP